MALNTFDSPKAYQYSTIGSPPSPSDKAPPDGVNACLDRIKSLLADLINISNDFENIAETLSGAIPTPISQEKSVTNTTAATVYVARLIETELANQLSNLRVSRDRISESLA